MSKTKGSRRGLATLGVLALVVLLAGTAWLRLGWRTVDLTLEDRTGDPAALRGFTLNGRINWNLDASSLHFSLHDGYLDTQLVLDDENAPFLNRPMVSTDQTYVVATPERASADRNAAEVPQFTDGTVTVQTTVNRGGPDVYPADDFPGERRPGGALFRRGGGSGPAAGGGKLDFRHPL